MAADRILVSTAEMNATIGKYEQAHNEMSQAFTALEQAREHIDRCWDGPAKLAYLARWANTYTNIRRSDNAIESTISSLRNVIQTMDSAEEETASKASSLDVGTTPPMF
jgi:WXG100 family type VII secretion target